MPTHGVSDPDEISQLKRLYKRRHVLAEHLPVFDDAFFTATVSALLQCEHMVTIERLDDTIPDTTMKSGRVDEQQCGFVGA